MDRLRERVPVYRPRPLSNFNTGPGAVPASEWRRRQDRRERDEIVRKSVATFIFFPLGWLVLSLLLLAGQP